MVSLAGGAVGGHDVCGWAGEAVRVSGQLVAGWGWSAPSGLGA
jgi:hypothetical protein